jgi:uncharacterized protein (TIGR03118 family)
MAHRLPQIAFLTSLVVVPAQIALCDIAYFQTNLTSDLPGVAANQDTNLVNPWGIAFSPTSPAWISDNGTGLSTLYNGAGQTIPLVVTVPPPGGGMPPSAPTGVVFNGTGDFGGSHFIFATEDGTISAWTSGSAATLEVDNSASGAVYKGLTLGNNGGNELLYAANFNSGAVDVFNSSFHTVSLAAGAFTDPSLPTGYAPFDIQNIGGMIYVTYALQDGAKHDDVAGAGHGFVDVYNTAGALQGRLISQGKLDSPWGLAVAPASFGPFGGDLLVGNFGSGQIDAYNPLNGTFLGVLKDSHGNPIVNQGLWGLAFGNGSNGFNANDLYFTAGIPGPGKVEEHGLFGVIQPTPEPSMFLPIGALSLALFLRKRRHS